MFNVAGYPVWSFFVINETPQFTSWELKTLLLQEMFANGIFTIGTHNMSYSHSEEDVDKLIFSYKLYFQKVKVALEKGNLNSLLHCEPLVPLFKLR